MTVQVSEMAIDLFSERGYEHTTVEDICQLAGISRTTFFRYFKTKEEVLSHDLAGIDYNLLAALIAQPERSTPWRAIRRTLDPLLDHYSQNAERTLRSAKLVIATPALITFHREKLARWGQALGPELARRIGADPNDPTDPRPVALITAALACLDIALLTWATTDGAKPLSELLDQAMSAIR
jgi:AcrR family transcriptional regulator